MLNGCVCMSYRPRGTVYCRLINHVAKGVTTATDMLSAVESLLDDCLTTVRAHYTGRQLSVLNVVIENVLNGVSKNVNVEFFRMKLQSVRDN